MLSEELSFTQLLLFYFAKSVLCILFLRKHWFKCQKNPSVYLYNTAYSNNIPVSYIRYQTIKTGKELDFSSKQLNDTGRCDQTRGLSALRCAIGLPAHGVGGPSDLSSLHSRKNGILLRHCLQLSLGSETVVSCPS